MDVGRGIEGTNLGKQSMRKDGKKEKRKNEHRFRLSLRVVLVGTTFDGASIFPLGQVAVLTNLWFEDMFFSLRSNAPATN